MQDQEEHAVQAAPAPLESPPLVPSEPRHLPVPVRPNGKRRLWRMAAALLIVVLGAGGGGYALWKRMHPPLPIGVTCAVEMSTVPSCEEVCIHT